MDNTQIIPKFSFFFFLLNYIYRIINSIKHYSFILLTPKGKEKRNINKLKQKTIEIIYIKEKIG